MKLNLKVWRQKDSKSVGRFEMYQIEANEHMSFLEMMDVLNQQLIDKKQEPVAFDHDCREGICGACSMVINGKPHGPNSGTTTCQLHMRYFKEGETIVIEPFRARSFPVIKDLVVDRTAFDRIIQAGGYISINVGQAIDGNSMPIEKDVAGKSFDAAACIGCGACVAACPNGSAMLFTAAKVSQGEVEQSRRVYNMVAQMDAEGFGRCSNVGACEADCPKEISLENIARMNRYYTKAIFVSEQ